MRFAIPNAACRARARTWRRRSRPSQTVSTSVGRKASRMINTSRARSVESQDVLRRALAADCLIGRIPVYFCRWPGVRERNSFGSVEPDIRRDSGGLPDLGDQNTWREGLNLQVRIAAAEFLGELPPVHVGHGQVRDQQRELSLPVASGA